MPEKNTTPLLTARELQVLKLLCGEKTNAEIAQKLNISVDGVKYHHNNIYKKLKCHSLLGMYKYALKAGLVKLRY